MDAKVARITKQIERLDLSSRILSRKEVRELPQILWDDEEIQDIVQGVYNNGAGNRRDRAGLDFDRQGAAGLRHRDAT
jgi:hypothetical protein